MTRFRAIWGTQAAAGWAVTPRILTRRPACSMTANTYFVAPVSVVAVKKSQATMAWAWLRGPGGVVTVWGGLDPVPLQDLPDGGGSDRDPEAGEFAVDATVTQGPVFAGQAQHERLDAAAGGRPGRLLREIFAWRRRIRSRCQRRIVSGDTISCNFRSRIFGSRCRSAARNTRSVPVNRGVSIWRCKMASW
jgi:hypothetical protein